MRIIRTLLCIAIPFPLLACQSQPYVTPERLDKGLVVVLPGIEGRSYLNESIRNGIVAGGVDYAVEIYSWGSFLGPFYNLRATTRNHKKSEELAEKIKQYKKDYPGRPVFLVGQSGGGAIAAWTAEKLPPGEKVDGIIMINAALSREYDLDLALKHSNRGIVNFCSNQDWVFLKLGTTAFGTMDGPNSASAGKEGFIIPIDLPDSYDKLFQIVWTKEMLMHGHYGGHLSSSSEGFISQFVAPLIRAPFWDQAIIAKIQTQDSLKEYLQSHKPAKPEPKKPEIKKAEPENSTKKESPAKPENMPVEGEIPASVTGKSADSAPKVHPKP